MVTTTFTAAGEAAASFPVTADQTDDIFSQSYDWALEQHSLGTPYDSPENGHVTDKPYKQDQDGVAMYKEIREIARRETRLSQLQEQLKNLTPEELDKIAHYQNVRAILSTSSHIIADRRQRNALYGSETFDRTTRRREMTEQFKAMKAQGVSEEDLRFLLNNIKIWLTITPHPTKDKNANGRGATRHLIDLVDLKAPAERITELQNEIRKMLDKRLTPDRKDTLEEESADARKVQLRYNRGMHDFLEDLQDSLTDSGYAMDLTAEDCAIDIALRDWFTGDADGKDVPAPVMFKKRVQDAIWALDENIDILGGDRDNEATAKQNIFRPHLQTYWQIKKNLEKLKEDTADIESAGAPSAAFDKALEAFGLCFRTAAFNGDVFESGPALTKSLRDDLRAKIAGDELGSDLSAEERQKIQQRARRVLLRHNQLGISMGKQEIRHNSRELTQIFDNLYAYLQKHHSVFIKENHFLSTEFARAQKKPFNAWPAERQIQFFNALQETFGQDGLKRLLAEANQNDPTAQGILERFKAYKILFNAKRRGIAIIAESTPMSPVYQQVLAEAFEIGNMVHCPLNEDKEAIVKASENMQFYIDNMLHKTTPPYIVMMDPQSDSQKGLSLFIKPTQHNLRLQTIKLSLAKRLAILFKKGTGSSYARGGYSPKVEPRKFIATLAEGMPHLFSKDGFFTSTPEMQKILRRLVSFVSFTIQGRDMGLRLGRPQVCYDMIHGIFQEIMGANLVLMGHAKPEHVAPNPPHYHQAMIHFMNRTDALAVEAYENLRADKSREKSVTIVLNNYMEAIAAPHVAEHAGVGARKPARAGAGKGKPKPATELRAIGSNILHEFGLTFHDGYYPLGHWMSALHDAYNNEQISRKDLLDLCNDEFRMRQMFSNAFAALAAADFEHGFDILFPAQDWTVGRVLEAVEANYQGLSENQALHVRIAYDALLSTSLMEALLSTGPGDDCAFDADRFEVIRKLYGDNDRLNILKFGPQTKEFYPHIADIQRLEPERRLSRALIHEARRRNDEGLLDPDNNPDHKRLLHQIACSARSWGPYNMGNLLDKPGSAFGAKPVPVLRRIMDFWRSSPAPSTDAAPCASMP